MSNIGNFKRVGREVVYKGKILEFCQDEIQTSKGHHVTWDFLNHKGAAAIVPVMDDGKILMVKQWRNVVNRVSLEIPAGAKDTVEEPTLECATRELEEETGYKPGRMEFLHTIVPAVAYSGEIIDIYVAFDLQKSHQNFDEDEDIELVAYTIEELNANLEDILHDVEKKALVSLDGQVDYKLTNKIRDGKLYVDQGIIAGCAGGGFENICAAADILKGHSIGADEFTLSVYPASMPVYMELIKNGCAADIMAAGGVMKTAFCGPCFGAGDTPANNAFSIRHSTRNFPNREGSKLQNGQISSVALMDARSIAATAANKGYLTAATDVDVEFKGRKYHFDKSIYENRVFDSHGIADPDTEIQFGPNIKDWPEMVALTDNLLLKVVSEIHDPVTTTDELIPSGETSSYRSNPLGLAEFALSRKDPEYVGKAKEVQKAEKAREAGQNPVDALPEVGGVFEALKSNLPQYKIDNDTVGIGSTIFAVKPGDGSAREQAASCQKVLGGWANIACEYATKRYRSNLINWGMLPFIYESEELPFKNGDYIFVPEIVEAVKNKATDVQAYVVDDDKNVKPFTLKLGEMTDDERDIILKGCLINYNRK